MKRSVLALAVLLGIRQAPAWAGDAAPEYRLQPGDTLNVTLIGHPDLSVRDEAVRPDGRVSLPLVSQVDAGGKTVEQVISDLQQAYRPFLTDPVVVVNVAKFHHLHVSVLGQVAKPGVYDFNSEPTLVEALAAAGGPTDRANRDDIEVAEPTGARLRFDLDKLLASPDQIPLIPEGSAVDVEQVWYPDLTEDLPIAATVLLAVTTALVSLKR